MTFAGGTFRFTLVPTLFTIPALIVLIGLGTWQVERLQWKTALIAERTADLAAPPAPIPGSLDAARALDFHHVSVAGVFDHTRELHIAALDARGVTGAQIVTPLTLADGRLLLINRGFVPERYFDPKTRAQGQIEGPVTVSGILRVPTVPTGIIVPHNEPKDGFWVYVDVPAMATSMGLDPDRFLPFYVEADKTPNPGGFPIGGQTRIALPNDHLQYAITWYCFAVTLIVIYFVYHWHKDEPPGPALQERASRSDGAG